MRVVSPEEGRRIAVRAQLLDGSADGVLETVRRLGFLQMDPIATVATPQELVLWSRLGSYDRAELDRLIWEERKLVEFDAFIYPVEELPVLLARAHRRRGSSARDLWIKGFLQENASFRRYVLRELERRGPLLSREIEDHKGFEREPHRWWGGRKMAFMLEVLTDRGEVAVAGRQGKQRLWDLADRVWPAVERITWKEAQARLEERRRRTQGVVLERGRLLAHRDADDSPVPPGRTTFLSPFDRLVHDRDRAEALWGFFYRLEMYVPAAKRQYGYYVLPILRGDRVVGRIEPVHDRKTGTLRVKGVWWEDKPVAIDRPLRSLARWLGATIEA